MSKTGMGIAAIVVPVLILFLFLNASQDDKIKRQQEFNNRYGIYALDLPEHPVFAGESIPVPDAEIKERFDRELLVNTYGSSQTLLLLKRKERWFGIIENVLKAHRIPDDFKYLALAESGFLNVVSPSGAAGYWQFLESTGVQYGLEISTDVDERYHVEKATRAACLYFKEAYNILGSWSLVAASYNFGIDGILKQMQKQKADNYYDLLLTEEASRYLFRIAALKEICTNPLKYGFHLRKRDFYQPYGYRVVDVDTAIADLASFARAQGTNYKFLKLLNPWLRTNSLSNKTQSKYRILIVKKNHPESVVQKYDTVLLRTLPSKEFHQE